jgi:hypothetical protein
MMPILQHAAALTCEGGNVSPQACMDTGAGVGAAMHAWRAQRYMGGVRRQQFHDPIVSGIARCIAEIHS